mgnify:CR=1 FL=1
MTINTKPDYRRWNEMYYWSREEAVYLLLGEEPVIPGEDHDAAAGFSKEHRTLYDKLEEEIEKGNLTVVNGRYLSRTAVLEWAEKHNLRLPGELLGESPLAPPNYDQLDRLFTPQEKYHAGELAAAVCVWNEMFLKERYNTSKSAKKQIVEFLQEHYPAMSKSRHDRIATVVMPDVLKKGAAG